MNDRQGLMAILQGAPCDKLPWFADLSYLYDSLERRGSLEAHHQGAEGYLRFYQDLGAGICFYAPQLWSQQYPDRIRESVSEQDGQRITRIQTPVGCVQQVDRYLPQSYTWATVEHFVKNISDLRILLYACEHRAIQPNFPAYARTDDLWSANGYAVGTTPLGAAPLQRLLSRWAGVTATMILYMDEQEELEALIKALEDCDDPIFETICQSPCNLVEFCDNLSAEITGRRFFEEYNAPYYQRRTAELHQVQKRAGIHNDGTLRGTFDLLGPCGFDVIEAVTPAPIGDIPLAELRACAGPAVVLWGGLPGVLFSPCYPDEDFENHLQEAIRVFRKDGRCILGVADQVPPDGLVARVKRVREVIGA